MKKVLLLVLAVMLMASFLMASGPPLKLKTLTVINKSGNDVMLKLTGSDVGKQFYYLTNPAGTKEWPTVTTWTVLEDIYDRVTYYGEGDNAECVGVSSSGKLIVDKNIRLTFTPCYSSPHRVVRYWDADAGSWIFVEEPNYGEPTMEKVVYFKYLKVDQDSIWDLDADDVERYSVGCGAWTWYYWRVVTNRYPNKDLCWWRYKY